MTGQFVRLIPDYAALYPGYRRLEGWQRVGNRTAAYPIVGRRASAFWPHCGWIGSAILLMVLFAAGPCHIGT